MRSVVRKLVSKVPRFWEGRKVENGIGRLKLGYGWLPNGWCAGHFSHRFSEYTFSLCLECLMLYYSREAKNLLRLYGALRTPGGPPKG